MNPCPPSTVVEAGRRVIIRNDERRTLDGGDAGLVHLAAIRAQLEVRPPPTASAAPTFPSPAEPPDGRSGSQPACAILRLDHCSVRRQSLLPAPTRYARISRTSDTRCTCTASSTSAGTSSRSGSLRCGRNTSVSPARWAASSFCFTPPIGQHPPGQRDLAGHADLGPHGAAGQQRDQRGRHRDAGRRPVLGYGAGGHVQVDRLARGRPPGCPARVACART